MSAILLMAVGLAAFTIGYLFYSSFIAERVFKLSSEFRTPAVALGALSGQALRASRPTFGTVFPNIFRG